MISNPVFSSIASGLMPDPYLTIDQWADMRRKLPQGASAEAGQYSTDRMPYLREVMQWLSPQDPTQQVKVLKGTQLGFTEVGNNVAMYYMDIVPTSQLMIMPTETLAKDHSNRKLTPSLRAMPYLSQRIASGKTKDDIGGTFEKIYPGGILKIAWAGSAANYRSISARVLVLDDVDGFPHDVEGEGDPVDLGKKRTDSFGNQRKIYINGTPTIKGKSKSDDEYEDSDQRRYYMPCPHCTPKDKRNQSRKNMVAFEKDHFKFDYDENTYELKGDVAFCCPHCGTLIEEHHKTWMMDRQNGAKTMPDNPGHKHNGLRVPSFYSPIGFLSWNDIFREFLQAKKAMNRGDVRKMKTWENTRNARAWEEELDTVEIEDYESRIEVYSAEVPKGVYVLTAGIDAQDDRVEIETVGWGKNEESWSIDYHVIPLDPQTPEFKKSLDEYLNRDFVRHDGSVMRIYAAAYDTGGHRTKAVYEYCKDRITRRIFAIKGSGVISAPITNHRFSRKNIAKVPVFMVGVNTAKDDIYAKLEISAPGPGYMHFPDRPQYDDRYFKMLTAERRDEKGRWVKYRQRNEAIDCRVYAMAAMFIAGADVEKMRHPHLYVAKAQAKRSTKSQQQMPKSHLDEF